MLKDKPKISIMSPFQIPMAVATSSQQASTEAKISSHRETFSKFHHVTTGSHPDIQEGKPAPDIFLICASLFDEKVEPSSCLVFEDAPSGVQAAIAAKMQVVAIPDKRVNPDIMADATQILYSMAQFRPEEFGLPPFEEWASIRRRPRPRNSSENGISREDLKKS